MMFYVVWLIIFFIDFFSWSACSNYLCTCKNGLAGSYIENIILSVVFILTMIIKLFELYKEKYHPTEYFVWFCHKNVSLSISKKRIDYIFLRTCSPITTATLDPWCTWLFTSWIFLKSNSCKQHIIIYFRNMKINRK